MTSPHPNENTAGRLVPAGAPREPLAARMVFLIAGALLRRVTLGSGRLTLPDGSSRLFGRVGSGHHADLVVRRARVLAKSLARGPVGFAESYMAGDWESAELADIFRFFIDARDAIAPARRLFRVKALDRIGHRLRRNSRSGSRRNIAYHYDLGNDFYRHWLDASMTYSSALFAGPTDTLEEAQRRKYRRVVELLARRSGEHVLEIGCGWGGFAELAAGEAGLRVLGLTLSERQLAYARARARASGLAGRIELRLEDYRDVAGRYDGIVSIEMIEAVGEENWPRYFRTLHDRLRPGGRAVIQAITIREDLFEAYRRRADFVQRYIFPGGMLPSASHIRAGARKAGFRVAMAETFGASYARTLWEWRARFLAAWPEISALGYDERFKRMWDYYLTYCAVGFEKGVIDVGLYPLARD